MTWDTRFGEGFLMDVDDYIRLTRPRAVRSRLAPFMAQVALLKSKGYTNLQVREWLAANGVDVSLEAVRVFVNKRILKHPPPGQGASWPGDTGAAIGDDRAGGRDDARPESENGLSLRQRGEQEAAKYLGKDALSPLTKRLMAKAKEKDDESSGD